MNDIVVLILAGGDGGRFWPLPDKITLPFLGKPLAYHHLSQLDRFGFKNIVVVTNGNNESFFNRLKMEFPNLKIDLVLQKDQQGMAGAILAAEKYIQGKSIIVRNGSDVYEDFFISQVVNQLKKNPVGLISGISQNTYFPGGYLKVSGGKVVSIIEKPDPDKIPSNIVTIVFDYFRNADLLLSAISKVKSSADDVFEKAIDFLIKDGSEMKFLPYQGFWGHLKFPWHVLSISSFFLDKMGGQRGKNTVIDKSAIIKGNVSLGSNARILENAKIIGPSYIGSGSIIGNNAIVRETMLGDNCVVGFGTEIARSYVGDNCWFHTNYVGDSIISDNVSMGAGAVLANFKLDESTIKSEVEGESIDTGKVKLGATIGTNVRIGVNSSVMPGVKIGKNSFLGSGVVLDKDLPDDKYCSLVKNAYTVKNNLANIAAKSRQEQRKTLKTG